MLGAVEEEDIYKGVTVQRRKGAKAQWRNGVKAQWRNGVTAQRHNGTTVQRCSEKAVRGIKGLKGLQGLKGVWEKLPSPPGRGWVKNGRPADLKTQSTGKENTSPPFS
jgi:hypothetical protein